MVERILIDGEPAAVLPADDRGLAYGDGVFRTLRIVDGAPVAWADHMQRLVHDCQRLALACPASDTLAADAQRLCGDNEDGVLKIMITRGSGGRGYRPPDSGGRRIVSAHALPAHARAVPAALELDYSPVTLADQPLLAGVKHLNRLEQVLAQRQCARAGCADALMCDRMGRPLCTTMRNLLFFEAHGRWSTPALTHAGVAGATRQRLLRALAGQGQAVAEVGITRADIAGMAAAIACNSVGGVAAVTRIGRHRFAESETAAAYCRQLLQTA